VGQKLLTLPLPTSYSSHSQGQHEQLLNTSKKCDSRQVDLNSWITGQLLCYLGHSSDAGMSNGQTSANMNLLSVSLIVRICGGLPCSSLGFNQGVHEEYSLFYLNLNF